jgi:ferredoxin
MRMDSFLAERLRKYTNWLEKGNIDYSSKVIPVSESLTGTQWVLPSQQVIELLKSEEVIALADCVCRSHYNNCDNPRNVCLLLERYGEKAIAAGHAERITHQEAERVLEIADKHGLVHLSLYRPDHRLYALCSCCPCCCHDLRLLLEHGQKHLVVHSDYVAVVDENLCTHCGICVQRCAFGARFEEKDRIGFAPQACFGCGLCAVACPEEAITMVLRQA